MSKISEQEKQAELRKKSELYNVIVCNTEQQKELSNQTLEYFLFEFY